MGHNKEIGPVRRPDRMMAWKKPLPSVWVRAALIFDNDGGVKMADDQLWQYPGRGQKDDELDEVILAATIK
jgi:hypothetical protein